MNGVAIGKSRVARRQGTRTLRPMIELMEDRVLLATFTVTNNADGGPGSLRQAILNANTTSGTDTINFNIKVGAISEVAIPTRNSGPVGITAGPDGNLWFTEVNGNKIGRITPGGTITEFADPHVQQQSRRDHGRARRQPLVHRVRRQQDRPDHPRRHRHRIPRSLTPNSGPIGITAGPDGNLWFTEYGWQQDRPDHPRRQRHRIRRSPRPTAVLSGSRPGPTATSGSPS